MAPTRGHAERLPAGSGPPGVTAGWTVDRP
jgi:hypothetical protein